MKMKKVTKIVIALLISLVLCMSFAGTVSFANNGRDIEVGSYTQEGADQTAVKSVYSVISPIIDILRIVGIGIALIILVWLGIKYVTGSPEGKAEYKKNFVPYIVGVVIIIAAVAILSIIQYFAGGITGTE